MAIKPRPIIGKFSLFVVHEGTKERVVEIYNFDEISEVRIDKNDGIVKILKKNAKEYCVVLEETNQQMIESFYNTLLSVMSTRMSPEEIQRANAIRAQLAEKQKKDTKTTKSKGNRKN